MKLGYLSLALVSSLALSACSSSEPEKLKPTEISNRARTSLREVPVVQVETQFNLPAEKAYNSLLDALREKNIPVSVSNESTGQIHSRWVGIEDRMCENGIASSAPVPCKVSLHFTVKPLSKVATSVTGRYRETCNFNDDIAVECPNSKAEVLLKYITQQAARR